MRLYVENTNHVFFTYVRNNSHQYLILIGCFSIMLSFAPLCFALTSGVLARDLSKRVALGMSEIVSILSFPSIIPKENKEEPVLSEEEKNLMSS